MRLTILFLCTLLSAVPTWASETKSGKPPALAKADGTFTRGAPFPKWIQPLADVQATSRTEPLVVRVMETQALVGDTPAIFYNRAIQVNDQSALGAVGQTGIEYYPSYQKLALHRVAIIRGGKAQDRTASVNVRLLERESNMENGTYGGAVTAELLLDDVRVGDTLLLTYSIEGDNPVFDKHWSHEFGWDTPVPVELRRLTVLHPKNRPLHWRQMGDFVTDVLTPEISEAGPLEKIRFEQAHIEPIESESSVPSSYWIGRELHFSEFQDWQGVAAWASGLFPKAGDSRDLKSLASQFAKEKTPEAQAAAALRWVQNEIRYFSVSIGENSHRPQPPDVVIKRRFGDCKDKSYLLVSLLKELGIEAHPILLDSEAPLATAKMIASPLGFDHVIVQLNVNGKIYYVDPTNQRQSEPLERMPTPFPDASGLVVDASAQTLTAFPKRTGDEPVLEHVDHFKVTAMDGDVDLEMVEIYRSDYADWARQKFPGWSANDLKKYVLEMYEKRFPGVSVVEAPKFQDFSDDNRVELHAVLHLPKPVTHENKRYNLAYDSQVMDGTLGLPDKLVRNYPFALPKGKYHGRYRLTIEWPKTFKLNEKPAATALDNPYFDVNEEYTMRGNYVSYLMDYHVKQDVVAAKDMPELSKLAKHLNDYSNAVFNVRDDVEVSSDAASLPIRDLDVIRAGEFYKAETEKWKKAKVDAADTEEICSTVVTTLRVVEFVGKSLDETKKEFIKSVQDNKRKKGEALCQARTLYAVGAFQMAVDLFQADAPLPDDSPYTLDLAWARFYTGDVDGALADLQRFHTSQLKAGRGKFNGLDIANEIALFQRAGKLVPDDLIEYAQQIPDGPWPRPLLAMQTGLMTPEALIQVTQSYPSDARAYALNEAWYYIGQFQLANQDKAAAKLAFHQLDLIGIRTTPFVFQGRYELNQLKPQDAQADAGQEAFDKQDYATAIEKWRASAKSGFARAQLELGQAYYLGTGVPQDYAQALPWMRLAAEQGDADAQNYLGAMYGLGRGVTKDQEAAVSWYEKAAAQDLAVAQYNLARRYLDGNGVAVDKEKALRLFEKSADQGYADAEVQMAKHFFSDSKQSDLGRAWFWAYHAAFNQNSDGQVGLGNFYATGKVVKKDPRAAVFWYRKAAEQGNALAQTNVGYAYDAGEGVERDEKLAAQWYAKAADQGSSIAKQNLGSLYCSGNFGTTQKEKGFQLVADAAKDGLVSAQIRLGRMYQIGYCAKQDVPMAMRYYTQAADAGSGYAAATMGAILEYGEGVEKNVDQAVIWFRKGIDLGSDWAQNNLGDMYENGVGVERDYVQALKLYHLAANAGFNTAFVSLGSMYQEAHGVQRNTYLAYTFYQMAVKKDEKRVAERMAEVERELTPDQIKRAQDFAATWKVGMPLPDVTELSAK